MLIISTPAEISIGRSVESGGSIRLSNGKSAFAVGPDTKPDGAIKAIREVIGKPSQDDGVLLETGNASLRVSGLGDVFVNGKLAGRDAKLAEDLMAYVLRVVIAGTAKAAEFGSDGGKASAAALSPKKRKMRARRAALARWGKKAQ